MCERNARKFVCAQVSSVCADDCGPDSAFSNSNQQQPAPCSLRLVAVLGSSSALEMSGERAADVGHVALVPTSASFAAANAAAASSHTGTGTPKGRLGSGNEQQDEGSGGGWRRSNMLPARSISSPDLMAKLLLQAQAAAAEEGDSAAPSRSPVDAVAANSVHREVVDRLLVCDTANLRIKLVEVVRVRFSENGANEALQHQRSSCSSDTSATGTQLENYHVHVFLASDATGWPCGSAMVAAGRLAVLETIRDPLHNIVKLIVNVYRSQNLLRASVLAASAFHCSPEASFASEELECAMCRGELPGTREDEEAAARPSSTAFGLTPRSSFSSSVCGGDSFECLNLASSLNEGTEVVLCEGDGAFIGGVHVQYSAPRTSASSSHAAAGQSALVPSRVLVNALAFEYVFEMVPETHFRYGGVARNSRELSSCNVLLRGTECSGGHQLACPRPKRSSVGSSTLQSSVSISSRPFFRVAETHSLYEALFDLACNSHFNVVLYQNKKVC